jgi:hypothetical protein
VNCAKHARQKIAVVGRVFERQKVVVELIEVLVALDEKFLDDIFEVIH